MISAAVNRLRANRLVLAILLISSCTGCLILPIPHTRLHAYGVRGRVVDAITGKPVQNATIRAYFGDTLETDEGAAVKSDAAGRFRVDPKKGLHGAYMIGPVSQSLWPGWDATGTDRKITIGAPGYSEQTFTIAGNRRDGSVEATVDGDCLVAGDLPLSTDPH